MPTIHHIAKAATPEEISWRQRIAREEKPLIAAFLAWAANVRAQIDIAQVAHAIITRGVRAFDHVLQAVEFQPVLAPIAEAEATLELDRIVRDVEPHLTLSFDLRNPHFTTAVQNHQARLVREVSTETRRNIANLIDRAYRQGLHPYEVAPQIKASVGLTARQGQAVANFAANLEKKGVPPDKVAARAARYADQTLTRRAKLIARTETARAAVTGRLAAYEQAAAAGLFDPATAQLEWSSVQTDPLEICAQLDGQRVSYGGDFDGLLPPAHPGCRCSVHLVL